MDSEKEDSFETPESRAVVRRLLGLPTAAQLLHAINDAGDDLSSIHIWITCPKCCAEFIKTGEEDYNRDMYPAWRTRKTRSSMPLPGITDTSFGVSETYDFVCTNCNYKFHIKTTMNYDDGHVYTPLPTPKKPRKVRSDKGKKRGPQVKATKRRSIR